MTDPENSPVKIAIVVGEESGDQLGAALMASLRIAAGDRELSFCGVGGRRMQAHGFSSLFDLSEIAVMGITAVLARLPSILARIRQTARFVIDQSPDILIIIDSPDFTHRVARKLRAARPDIAIVDYVSPSIWAWRPGRARKMTAYVDHILAILPFEPAAHKRLGGPKCSYVGHPLIERRHEFRPGPGERPPVGDCERPVLLVLPGSRRGEIDRMMPVFGEALTSISARAKYPPEIVLPAVPHLEDAIGEKLKAWPVSVQVVSGETEKLAAFRRAHAALATSGTVSLELALAGIPCVIAYRLDAVYRQINRLRRFFPKIVQVDTMVLPNIILGEKAIPEFLDMEATPSTLTDAVLPLLTESPERNRQLSSLAKLDTLMTLPGGVSPGQSAARIVLDVLETKKGAAKRPS